MPENPQINPFEEYYKLTERQAMLNAELAGGSLVDGMRQTYALVHQRVSDRLQELEAQPEHLLDGAFQAVDTSSTAIGQLEAIEDLLTPEEFAGQYGAYKSRIQKAVDFIFEKAELSDPRLEWVTETANKVGAIIVRDVVIGLERVPLTEPEKAELHADTAPAEADLSQLSPIARVATYARALPVNSRQDLKPSQLWAVASDGGEFGPNDWARLKRLFTRLQREGIPVEHNGKRGSGSAYVLSAFRGELASEQRAAQVDAVFPLVEAANIASFFTLFDDVLASKGIEPINRDVAGYCIDALPEGGEPLSNEEVQKMRAGIAAKIVQLAENPEQIDELLGLLPRSDPRYDLLLYIKTLQGNDDAAYLINRFGGAFVQLQTQVATNKKEGGVQLQAATPIVIIDGEEIGDEGAVQRRAREKAAHSRATTADTMIGDLSSSERAQKEHALEEALAEIAKRARRNGIYPDRPYMRKRFADSFSDYTPEKNGGTVTILEVAAAIVSAKGLVDHYGDTNQALVTIKRYLSRNWQS